MNPEQEEQKKYKPGEITETLLQRIKDVRKNSGKNPEKVYRFEFKTDQIDILNWLQSQKSDTKIFFSGREVNSVQIAGIGIASVFFRRERESIKKIFEEFDDFLDNFEDSTRFYGGVSFADDPGSGREWASFGSVKFILPRFELARGKNNTVFAANYLADELKEKEITELEREIGSINFSDGRESFPDTFISSLNFLPDLTGWKKVIEGYLNKIRLKEIRKIVAARRTEVCFDKEADPFVLLRELEKNKDKSTVFLFSFDGESFFTGSTPERLFHRDKDMLRAEAVAGTRPRGKTGEEDIQLGKDLLFSPKETREQKFVSEEISDKLKDICEYINVSEKKLLKLSTLQHLYNKIDGRLRPGTSDKDVLTGLFPTSAVSGLPKDTVMKMQKDMEPFDRGWYSGLVGFAGREESDLFVAIRSSLFRNKCAFFYSGAGIVEGSDPDNEWEEIDLKIKKFLRVFNYEN
ncbi:MAG: isochorismate synthase [Acidobacteriota bacterium]